MIREATNYDIINLISMGEKLWRSMPRSESLSEYRPADFEATCRQMIESDTAIIFMHESGMIGGVLAPQFFNVSDLTAFELFWWAEQRGGLLLRRFERWAKDRGARAVHVSFKKDRPVELGRLGYVDTERVYVRSLCA